MHKEFINETETDEKYINDEIFWKYFKYQSPSFLTKDLFKAKNNKLVNNINDSLIDLRNAIVIGAIPENEIPKKIVDIVDKTLDFNKQQKRKGLSLEFCRSQPEILSPKQMLQKSSIALAQVKPGDTSENLLNEIKQTIYSLYRAKEITKNVYNNIMNSIKL